MNPRITGFARLLAGTAIGAALLVGSAGAQQPSQDAVRKAFAAADANGDGYLNIDEYIANVIYVFRDADKNRDGLLVEQESIAYSTMHTPERFKSADRNTDGKVSVGEAVAIKVIDFFEIDTSRDGVLSVDEVLVYERSLIGAGARK
jgi:hypothetical protein